MALKIAIIGAGPAGCALARLLQQSSQQISVSIFEGEAGIDFRSQGGTLDLHTKTGQACLKAANLFAEFEKHARYDGEAMNICDKRLLSYIKQGASKAGSITGRPEIDRPKLRELLYNSLAPDTVRWRHKLTHVSSNENRNADPNGNGEADISLHFADGSVETGFDLVVGADGAWSKVRPFLCSAQPYYSGIGGHAFRIPDAETTQPELYKLVNRGSLFSFSDAKSIMAQYMGDGSINIGTWSLRPADWQGQGDVHSAGEVKAACREEFADWDERLLAFTQVAEDHVTPRDLYMLPIGHRWEHVRGVTLVGDAAHLMTPFAGEGVNLALEDSLKLAQAIISAAQPAISASPSTASRATSALNASRGILDHAVAAFEQDMFARATATQQLTWDMLHAMFLVPGAPRNGIERYIIRAVEGEMGRWVTRLVVAPLVYAYFFVFKLIW